MYSPLNAITSSQTGIVAIPDSPERRTFAYTNETTTAVDDGYKAKSESPELTTSVHEFPASSTYNGTDDALNRIEILEDPVISSLSDTALQVSNANVSSDQRPPAAPSSELQELTVPSGALRRSPFIDHSPPRAATKGGAFRFNDLRKQPPNSAEPITTTETGKESGQAQQDFPLTQSPIGASVSGRLPLPGLSDSPRRENNFGESLVPGIRKELSLGPRLPSEHKTVSQGPGEEQSWVDHPSAEPVSGVPTPRDAADRQEAREPEDEIDTSTYLVCNNVQASDEMALRVDKSWSSHHSVPVLLDEALDHKECSAKEGSAATACLRETEPQQGRPDSNATCSSEDAIRPIKSWTTHNKNGGRVITLHDTAAGEIAKQQVFNHRDWKVVNGAEIISIEETEDESFATRPRPAKRRAAENPDIWAVPSDTDQEALSRITRHSNRSSVQRNNLRTPVTRKGKSPTTKEQKHQSIEKVVQPPIDRERLAEQLRKEQEKGDKTNARRMERTAEKRAQEVRLTEEEGAKFTRTLKDQRQNEGTKAGDMPKNAEESIIRGKSPSVHASAHKRMEGTRALSPARSEMQASTTQKTSRADRSTEERAPKWAKNDGEKACDVKSENNSKKATIVEEGYGGEGLEVPRTFADQEADMAARQADAIARVERSVKLPSNSQAAKKRGSSVVSTGLKSDVVRKLEGPTEAQSWTSPNPGTREDTGPKRRSMTPLFLSSYSIKPVRSALRGSESLSHRSVSFNDDAIAINSAVSKPAKTAPSQGNSNLSRDIQPPAKAAQPRASKSQSSPSTRVARKRESDKAGDSQGQKPAVSRLATPSRDSASIPKIQTKLNVTRDVKLKGRAVDPPLPKPVKLVEDEVVISSDSERSVSTFYSDEDGRHQPVKAGPSSRKKLSSPKEWDKDVWGQNTTPTTSASRSSSISRSAITARTKVDFPVTVTASHDGSERELRDISIARSPAEYMSRAASASSRSQSSADSHTASESGSQAASGSEEDSEPEYGSDHEIGAPNHLNVGLESKPAARAVQYMRGKSSTGENGHLTVESRSKVPQSRLTSSKNSSPTSEEKIPDEKGNLAQQLEQQLQRDCRRSMEPQSTKQPALPSDRSINNKANSAKPLAAEPPKTRFPSLSALRSRAPKNTMTTSLTQPPKSVASKRPGQVQRSPSTSESDDESSSSEDDDSDGKPAKRTSSGGNRMTKIIKRMLFL